MITKLQAPQLRLFLRRGDNKDIAEQCKCSRVMVSQVLTGHWPSARILTALYEKARENAQKDANLIQLWEQLEL